jgi:rRNA maturation protein Nop10
MEQYKMPSFKITWCPTCRVFFVECPRCGNNTCNGGYGEKGKCPVCPKAYDLNDKINEHEDVTKAVYDLLDQPCPKCGGEIDKCGCFDGFAYTGDE